MQRKHILAVAIALSGLVWQPAFALVEVNDCDPKVAEELVRDSNAALEEAKKTNQALGDAMLNLPRSTNRGAFGGAFSCIDRLKDLSVSGSLGIPTIGSILDGILGAVGNAVCGQVNGVLNEASRTVNQSISFPGIPGVSGTGTTGSIYVGGAGGVNVNGQPVSTPGINGASRPQFQTANPQAAQQSQPQPTVFERLTRSIRNAF
jgi:hypothetical protein